MICARARKRLSNQEIADSRPEVRTLHGNRTFSTLAAPSEALVDGSPRDRRSQRVLRSYRRVIYDASESSSPVSDSEQIEKYEENETWGPGGNLTSAVNFRALKGLARWDFLGYPQSYPAIERAGATSTDTACCPLIPSSERTRCSRTRREGVVTILGRC